MNELRLSELIDFIKFIDEFYTDSYGHLQICKDGDELDPTYENVAKEYIRQRQQTK